MFWGGFGKRSVIYSIFRDGKGGNNGGLVGIELYNRFVRPLQWLCHSAKMPLSLHYSAFVHWRRSKRRLSTAMRSEPGRDCIYRNAQSDTAAESGAKTPQLAA